MNSIIKVQNIWAEDLFEWFFQHIGNSGGDGAGAIVCGNPKETAEQYDKFLKRKFPQIKAHFPRRDLDDKGKYVHINWGDSNENHIFTDNKDFSLSDHDYTFIVESDLRFGWTEPKDFKILKV